jgi:hypothetical protein
MLNAVAEALSGIASRRPLQTVKCLESLIEGDSEGWGILGSEDHARAILTAATSSGDVHAREAATALIHRLGRSGRLAFRDLLL